MSNNILTDAKLFFNKYPASSMHALYIIGYLAISDSIRQTIQSTSVVNIIFACIAISLLTIIITFIFSNNETIATRPSFKRLPTHHINELKALTPSGMLTCMEDVMLASLNSLYNNLKTVDIGGNDLYEIKYGQIVAIFKKIKAKQVKADKSQSRQAAIITFAFFRVLYKDLLEHLAITDDNNKLLKKVSPKLARFLGAEAWRLYEFREAVYGDLDKLSINADIAEDIRLLSGDKNQLSVNNDADKIVSQEEQNKIIADFKSWLEQKIASNDKEYRINRGFYVFAQELKYGADTVFVSNSLLLNYEDETAVAASDINKALKAKQDHSFQAIKNETIIDVIKIDDVDVTVPASKPITIKEITHDN